MPVKLLCGNDEYSINAELEKIRKAVLKGDFATLNRKVLSENLPKQIDMIDVLEAIETIPMMFGNSLVEIKATSLFTRGKADNEKLLTRLVDDIASVSDNLFVVFICVFAKDSDKKVDSSKKIVKAIKEAGEIKEFNVFKFYETDKYIDWIMKQAKAKKLILSSQNANLLYSYAGADFRTLDSELEKLKTYILPANEIKKEDIISLSQENEDAFKVLDLWLKNDKYSTVVELGKLMQKDAPQKIIALFQTTVKRWLRIKLENEFSGADEISKIVGKHPYFVKNEIIKLKNTTKEQLLDLRKNLNKAEYQMKSGELADKMALEMALVL